MNWFLIVDRSSEKQDKTDQSTPARHGKSGQEFNYYCHSTNAVSFGISRVIVISGHNQTTLFILTIKLTIASIFGNVFDLKSHVFGDFNVENGFNNEFDSEKSGLNNEYNFDGDVSPSPTNDTSAVLSYTHQELNFDATGAQTSVIGCELNIPIVCFILIVIV